MRTSPWAFVLVASLVPASAAAFEEVGAGAVVGDPIGLTIKLWFDKSHAADFGIGWSGDTVIWGDLLWHDWNLLPQPSEGKLAGYLGLGPRLETKPDSEFALRGIAGAAWRLSRNPVELFVEAGPVFRMTPRGGVGVDAGAGVRVYLGSKR